MLLPHYPDPLAVISRHPPLLAELVRRFTRAPLPAPADTVVDLYYLDGVVPSENPGPGRDTDTAFEAGIYAAADWQAGSRRPALTVTITAHGDDSCKIRYRAGVSGEDSAWVRIGADSGDRLADGGPWMAILAAVVGATNLADPGDYDQAYAAIDATGSGPAGIRALHTMIMRAAVRRARSQHEIDAATWRDLGRWLSDEAYTAGYAHGLQRGRAATAVVMVLTGRGISLTDRERKQIVACVDGDRLARWFDRALTAETAADVLRG
jgi:hypothetical protein